jgi:mevalonate pyrophosphate decarboxylase
LLSELPNALETIRMSTSNDIAAAALPKALASVAGEGKVTSNADIQRYARTGGLDERLIQGATNFITGRATQTKKEEAEKYASAVYRGALMERKKFIQSEAKQLGYDQSPNYSQAIADIDAELAKFKKPSDNKPVDSVVRVKPTGNPLIDKYLNQ